jgi:hypothetical protein
MTTMTSETEQQVLFDTIYDLLGRAVIITKDEHPVDGVTSWVEFAVNSESDLSYFITRNEDGTLSYLMGYGILLNPGPVNKNRFETYENFMWLLMDDNGFTINCTDWECDGEGTDCELHPNVNAKKAWKLIQKYILSEFS